MLNKKLTTTLIATIALFALSGCLPSHHIGGQAGAGDGTQQESRTATHRINPFAEPLLEFFADGEDDPDFMQKAFWANVTGSGNFDVVAVQGSFYPERTLHARIFAFHQGRIIYKDVRDLDETALIFDLSITNIIVGLALGGRAAVSTRGDMDAWNLTFFGVDTHTVEIVPVFAVSREWENGGFAYSMNMGWPSPDEIPEDLFYTLLDGWGIGGQANSIYWDLMEDKTEQILSKDFADGIFHRFDDLGFSVVFPHSWEGRFGIEEFSFEAMHLHVPVEPVPVVYGVYVYHITEGGPLFILGRDATGNPPVWAGEKVILAQRGGYTYFFHFPYFPFGEPDSETDAVIADFLEMMRQSGFLSITFEFLDKQDNY